MAQALLPPDLQIASPCAAPPPMALPRRRRLVRPFALVVLLGVCGLLLWEVGYVLFGSNFHEVLPGRIYRGAQPSPAKIESLVRDYGIRTIVNLRGFAGDPWIREQCQTVQRLGICQEDISFAADRLPSATELRRFIDVLDHADYPLFMHCRRGSDRTGLMAAIALLLQPGSSLEESSGQLSLRFGHMPVGRTTKLDEFLKQYERWLEAEQRLHDATAFRHWAVHAYRAGPCSSRIEECTPLQLHAYVGEPLGFRVRVRHAGVEPWQLRPGRFAGMHLGFRLWDDANQQVGQGRAGLVDRVVAPGESLELTLVVPPLNKAGRYRLLIDMVEENHCWFMQAGGEPREEELNVREKPAAAGH